jgi:hypothetical protein
MECQLHQNPPHLGNTSARTQMPNSTLSATQVQLQGPPFDQQSAMQRSGWHTSCFIQVVPSFTQNTHTAPQLLRLRTLRNLPYSNNRRVQPAAGRDITHTRYSQPCSQQIQLDYLTLDHETFQHSSHPNSPPNNACILLTRNWQQQRWRQRLGVVA